MRLIPLLVIWIFLVTACAAAPTTQPAPALTSTSTALTTLTPTPEWGIAFAVLAPEVIDAEGAVEGNLPSSLHWIRQDGSGLTQLTEEMEFVTNLAASPDGRYLLFSARREDTSGDHLADRSDLAHLYIVDVQSGNIVTLTRGIEFTEWQGGAWSPDGERIAFAARAAKARSDFEIEGFRYLLSVINRDSTGRRSLLEREGIIWNVAWSPTGEWIAFEQNGAIWVIHPDGSGLNRLIDIPLNYHLKPYTAQPVWSPDGQRIAFVAPDEGGNADVFVINTDGSGLLNLTKHPAEDIQPAWSPDGRYIAFRRGGLGVWSIFLAGIDGSECREVFSHPDWAAKHPTWSPDGLQMVVVGSQAWEEHPFVANLRGEFLLLSEKYMTDRPVWVRVPER